MAKTTLNAELLGRTQVHFDLTKVFSEGDLLSKHYAEYRHRYCEEMYQLISDYCRETIPDLDLAVDVACGPGNSTIGFCKHFKRVIGVDISETQIRHAPKDIPNCEFKIGLSDKIPFLKDASVDLFCVGTALQYLPIEETFAEADRVLRPGGTIAVFGYQEPRSANPEIDQVIREVFNKMLPYCNKESSIILNRYADINLPYPGCIRNHAVRVTEKTTVSSFLCMLRSYSFIGVQLLEEDPDLLKDVEQRLIAALNWAGHNDPDRVELEYYHDLFILMGHKPNA